MKAWADSRSLGPKKAPMKNLKKPLSAGNGGVNLVWLSIQGPLPAYVKILTYWNEKYELPPVSSTTMARYRWCRWMLPSFQRFPVQCVGAAKEDVGKRRVSLGRSHNQAVKRAIGESKLLQGLLQTPQYDSAPLFFVES